MKNYRHAVIALDLFEPYEAFLARALAFAKLHTHKISIVHVVPFVTQTAPYAVNIQDYLKEDADKKFNALKSQFADDKEIDLHLLLGNPKREITDFAKNRQADLLITGSHGKHGMDLLLGSTANGLVHLADCDVLTIRIDNQGHCLHKGVEYKRILLATDLADDSEVVAKTALEIANESQADFQVINVVPDAAMLSIAYIPNLEVEIEEQAKNSMKAFQTQHDLKDTQTKVVVGQPKHQILEAANLFKAELVVVGSHGRNGISSLLLGSTANAVLHGAKTDVLVVRIKK